MPGNPHFAGHLADHSDTNDGRTISAGLLALAWEQRTASLMEAAANPGVRAVLFLSDEEIENMGTELRARLGLPVLPKDERPRDE